MASQPQDPRRILDYDGPETKTSPRWRLYKVVKLTYRTNTWSPVSIAPSGNDVTTMINAPWETLKSWLSVSGGDIDQIFLPLADQLAKA